MLRPKWWLFQCVCLYCTSLHVFVFRTESGPIRNSRSVAEDRNSLIRPHAAPVPRYYKSHVSSKCITLQQESHPPPLRRQIQISGPCTSTKLHNDQNKWQNYPALPCICELFSPKTLFLLPFSITFSVAVKRVDWSRQCVSLLLIFYITSLHTFM